jgi:hypothetical protein
MQLLSRTASTNTLAVIILLTFSSIHAMGSNTSSRSTSPSSDTNGSKSPATQISDQDPLSGICISDLQTQPVDNTWINDLYGAIVANNTEDLRTALEKFNKQALQEYLDLEKGLYNLPPLIQAVSLALNAPEKNYTGIITTLIH